MPVEDHLHGLGRRTLAVRVLDAQDEHAVMTARVKPAEQRGAHSTDVQETGRAGRKAGADGHGPAILSR
jgi:hypothetical protein